MRTKYERDELNRDVETSFFSLEKFRTCQDEVTMLKVMMKADLVASLPAFDGLFLVLPIGRGRRI